MSTCQASLIVGAAMVLAPFVVHSQTPAAGFTPGSFRVTESGAAEYRIPIKVPPGIAGMEPKLALVYNSQSGNGLLGVGWNLEGLSAITRCPRTMAQDGVRGGVNYDSGDRYCLDGQRLFAVYGAYGADGTEYRTERESFSKIISFGVSADGTPGKGPAWFKVWTKSGQIIEYGNTPDSRIEAQGKLSVRVWAMNKASDRNGNYFAVRYIEELADGDYRPSRIDYGASSGDQVTPPSASVRFSPETRPDDWPRYSSNSVIRSRTRLTNIGLFVGETLVREYRMRYQTGPVSRRSRLASVTECASGDACLPAVDLAWINGGTGITAILNNVAVHGGNWTTSNAVLSVGDFNGDGYHDLFVSHAWGGYFCAGPKLTSAATFDNCVTVHGGNWTSGNATLTVADFNADGFTDILVSHAWGTYFCAGPKLTSAAMFDGCTPVHGGNWTTSNAALSVGDYNGDGYPDIFVAHTWGGYFCAGPKFTSAATFDGCVAVHGGDWTSSNAALSVGDFNGDGYADIFVAHTWGGFFCAGPKLTSAATFDNCVPVHGGNWTSGNATLSVADFNADGYTDIFVSHAWGSYFCAGPLLASASTFDNCVPVHGGNWTRSNAALSVADFNGDGYPDIFVHHPWGTYFCAGPLVISAATFDGCVPIHGGNWYYDSAALSLGDFNGDGNADFLVSHSYGTWFASGGVGVPDTLSSVSHATLTTFSYASLTSASVYSKGSGAAYPLIEVAAPLNVVASVAAADGSGGSAVTNFRYGGARSELTGRGFLGFRWSTSTQLVQGMPLTATTTYLQSSPFIGLACSVQKQAGMQAMSTVSYTYKVWRGSAAALSLDPGQTDCTASTVPTASPGERHFAFVSQTVETGTDLNGAALPTVNTTMQYDIFGNAKAISVSTGDGHSKTTTNDYINDDGPNWLLGRLKSSTVTSTLPAP